MADSFVIDLNSRSTSVLEASGYSLGDANLYIKVYSPTTVTLLPGEQLNAVVIPRSAGVSTSAASGMVVSSSLADSPDDGIFTFKLKNETTSSKSIAVSTLLNLQSYDFENSIYDLHWAQLLSSFGTIYDNYSGFYSYPHNLQGAEVSLTMEPISGTIVRYGISFPEVVNETDALYTGSHQPYHLGFFYDPSVVYSATELSGTVDGNDVIFTVNETSGYAPASNTGLIFELPMFDPREGYGAVPGNFEIYVGYRGAGGAEPQLLTFRSSHKDFLDQVLPRLEGSITNSFEDSNFHKVGEILIPAGTIQRKRLAIGIKDIYISKNVYNKKGVYISPYYYSENGIYTFSIRADEILGNYPGVDPYSTVRYFIEFNGLEWVPISPFNREQEVNSNGEAIPKLLVFDKAFGQSESVKYLNYTINVSTFRVKIVLDTSAVTGNTVPPEIKNYKCIIFDKNQLLEI